MTTIAPHIRLRGLRRIVFLLVTTASIAAAATTAPATSATHNPAPPLVYTISYTAHTGARREATVLLPAGYGPDANQPIPLVISPHGRGATGRSNATFWGTLPTVGGFAVVNPDGMGRRLKAFSYGATGHIDDLARMPEIVTKALPWVRIDRSRIYALGSSMGGQETLLLVARHPHLLAGAAAMDSVTDLALRYDQALELPTNPEFVRRWGAPNSVALRGAMSREVGGSPDQAPQLYAALIDLGPAQTRGRRHESVPRRRGTIEAPSMSTSGGSHVHREKSQSCCLKLRRGAGRRTVTGRARRRGARRARGSSSRGRGR